MTLLPKKQAKE